MVMKIPSLSWYSTLLHIEKCGTKVKNDNPYGKGSENLQVVKVFDTSTH